MSWAIRSLKDWEIGNKEIKMNKEIQEELKVLKGLTLEIGSRLSNMLEKLAKSGIEKVNDEVRKGEDYPFSKWVEEQLERISKIGEEEKRMEIMDEVKKIDSIPNWMQHLGKGKVEKKEQVPLTWQYEALDCHGRSFKGTMKAFSSVDVIKQIKLDGNVPTSIYGDKATNVLLKNNLVNVSALKDKRNSDFSMCSNGVNSYLVENPSVEWVKEKMLAVGSKIGSIWFYKEDGSLRKMSFRLHVKNPSVVKKPNRFSDNPAEKLLDKMGKKDSKILTVYDVNKVVRDSSGKILGRGSYRSVPLDRVIRIVSDGTTYMIERSEDINCPDCSNLRKPLVITMPKTVVRVNKR